VRSPSAFPLRTAADAEAALAYFNAFHDGFIRTLTLRSHDDFESRGVHNVSGRLDLELLFAHHNYRQGEPPADQLVRARFDRVSGLRADLPFAHGEWSIDRVEIEVETCPSGSATERCLAARIVHHRLVNGAWTTAEGLRFAFEEGEVEELFG